VRRTDPRLQNNSGPTHGALGIPNFRGAQIYAMRADGSGLRQLTAARGRFTDAEGFQATELPGQLAYSSLTPRALR
jgi:hypothetical protein